MPTPQDSDQNENTYVIDPESATEMARLMNQDRIITDNMGRLLPEQLDLSNTRTILDLACGPGAWALNIAFAYPKIEVVGIDISKTMIDYARAQAWSQGLNNASFKVMNVLKPLDFPDNSFDGINARLMVGFMPKSAWSALLQECWRITRPGGFICLTESDEFGNTNSAAYEKGKIVFFRALQLAGMTSPLDERSFGITPLLTSFLRKAGYQNIQRKPHTLDFSAYTDIHQAMFQNFTIGTQLAQPFMIKMGQTTPQEAEQSIQQLMIEMMSDDFCALWYYLSVFGIKPQ